MTVTTKDIATVSYKEFSGPFFRGVTPFKIPDNPSDAMRMLAVFTSTESGRFDAYNGYDKMIASVGLIQLGEAGQYAVSDLLGHIVEVLAELPAPLKEQCRQAGVSFTKNNRGRWRFFFHDSRGEVDRLQEQQELFLLHSDGHKGTWDPVSLEYAKNWAAAFANTLAIPEAQVVQVDHVLSVLMNFVVGPAKPSLFGPLEPKASTGSADWVGALRAAYLSFAGNLPSVAAKQLQLGLASTTALKWSTDWCTTILKQLTFGPNIAIYPARYNAIRPVVEKLYGVDLPDFATELANWHIANNVDVTNTETPTFTTVTEIQTELIAEGYDLGPAGADGKMGGKTTAALRTFQGLHGLTADGVVGPKTRKALAAEYEVRYVQV